MKKYILISVFVFLNTHLICQCLNADSLYVTNITYINAQANWSPAPSANHYLIHYREVGTPNWSNVGNIDSTMVSRNIPQLQPLTTYEWQIKTFCDTSNHPNSGWSVSDTFETVAFVPSVFNPIITPIIGNVQCNENTPFSIVASQVLNEPDIDSTIFWSNKGYFEINSLSSGDTVGDAVYTSNFLNFNATLTVWFTAGPNYAAINSIDDSTGSTMGFFIIENLVNGIKVSSGSPNDLNNYTNGYTSRLNFIDLFVNPNIAGPITFIADIESELGDVISAIDSSIIINCATSITEISQNKKLIKIVDILGRNSKIVKGKILFFIYQDGRIEKKYFFK